MALAVASQTCLRGLRGGALAPKWLVKLEFQPRLQVSFVFVTAVSRAHAEDPKHCCPTWADCHYIGITRGQCSTAGAPPTSIFAPMRLHASLARMRRRGKRLISRIRLSAR